MPFKQTLTACVLQITNQQKIWIFDFGLEVVLKQALMYAVCLASSLDHLQRWIKPVHKITTSYQNYARKYRELEQKQSTNKYLTSIDMLDCFCHWNYFVYDDKPEIFKKAVKFAQ